MFGAIDCRVNTYAGSTYADCYRPVSDAWELGDSTRLGDFTHPRSQRVRNVGAGKAAIDVTLLGRFYERFADHAVEVGRRVVFQVTGQPHAE